jgi:hypothetical protein
MTTLSLHVAENGSAIKSRLSRMKMEAHIDQLCESSRCRPFFSSDKVCCRPFQITSQGAIPVKRAHRCLSHCELFEPSYQHPPEPSPRTRGEARHQRTLARASSLGASLITSRCCAVNPIPTIDDSPVFPYPSIPNIISFCHSCLTPRVSLASGPYVCACYISVVISFCFQVFVPYLSSPTLCASFSSRRKPPTLLALTRIYRKWLSLFDFLQRLLGHQLRFLLRFAKPSFRLHPYSHMSL